MSQKRVPSMSRRGFRAAFWLVGLSLAIGGRSARAEKAAPPGTPDPQVYGISLTPDQFEHWAFRPIAAVSPPAGSEWGRNPIDAFIWQRLQAKGLSPAPPAEPRVWLRRVTFDLIGLPPTPAEMEAFLANPTAEARQRVVDRLLADPGYGVRWGRRWLDLVRYGDTNGYERDGNKPQAWRYRDYVIHAFNADKPFDRFVTEQLAGDELPDATAETMIATTFLRLGTWDDEPADPLVDRYDQLDDVVKSVSATFLGLTLSCARCHNHKFEPFSQLDYAGLAAFFEPLKRPQNGREDLDVMVGSQAELRGYQEAAQRCDAVLRILQEQAQALSEQVRARHFAAGKTSLKPEAWEAQRLPPDKRNDVQKKLVKETEAQLNEELQGTETSDERRQREGFAAAVSAIEAGRPTPLPRAYIWQEPSGPLPESQVFRRGNPETPAGVVPPQFPAVLIAANQALLVPPAEARTSWRRLSLARWLTSPANPLTARVAVNRIWQGHFGEGLVRTENDFGVMGASPSHPELLDWLAHSFQEGGWRTKDLHRLIVLSNTYAQASTRREDAQRVDPDNQLLARFPYRRLEAEPVRDAVLAVSGRLNPQMDGPGVYPKISPEVLASQSRPGNGWGAYDAAAASRRSIYVFVKRSLLVPLLDLLDLPDTTAACEQRNVSTIPTQALTLLNGEFMHEQAALFAERLVAERGSQPERQVERAYELALSRPPTAAEKAAALAFLERQQAGIEKEGPAATPSGKSALQALCLVLFNLNEFFYVD